MCYQNVLPPRKNVLPLAHESASERNAEWEVGDNGGYVVDGEWKLKR
jgi:hypothetical protein